MLKYLSNIITSTNPNLAVLQLLLFLAIVLLSFYLYRLSESPYSKKNNAKEGFQQEHPYVQKQNQEIYDKFYAEMYDGVNNRNKICQRELFQIVKMTEPSTLNSVFLDVGSGTGCVLDELTNSGYAAYGIDKSEAMVEYAEKTHPNIIIQGGDVLDPMNYENGTFTHVLCLNMTIYEIPNKSQFFSNCYYWMKPNSYLIIHLVNRDKFSTKKYLKNQGITTLYDNIMPESETNEHKNIRKTSESVVFEDCKYEEKYDFSSKDEKKTVVFTQIFTDNKSKNIRRNEQVLTIESIDEILDMAKRSGFIVHAKTAMDRINGDENQYLYVLERTM